MNEKEIIEREKLYEDFQKEFPLERLRNLTIDEYTNLDRKTSFCYWLESKTEILGSIWGGSAYKFGIYKWTNTPTAKSGVGKDDNYAWYSRYGNTANEAYKKVHEAIVSVAENARSGKLSEIDNIDLGDVYKWKIAFLYSNKTLCNMFAKDGLEWIAKKEGIGISKPKISEIQKFLIDKKGGENIFAYGERLWSDWLSSEEYKLKIEKNKNQTEFQGDANMPNPNEKIDDYKKLLEANKNLILHGAPGTGKTHTAKDIAAQMICGKSYAEVEKDEALNKQFNEQTEFVQFHPSYDYSDFVEGLRPIEGDNRGDVGFERKDGVFKEFCKRALKAKDVQKAQNEMTLSQNEKSDSNENIFDIDILLNRFKEDVEKADGPILIPYTDRSKAFEITGIKSNGSFSIELENGSRQSTKEEDVRYTLETGERKPKQTYSYCIARYIKEKYNLADYKENFIDPEDNITDNRKKPFVFIIDEINRGEMSKIFGELFFSIDPDYRGTKGKVRTQYANMLEDSNDFDDALGITTSYGHFFVPENVYIIGTMNDIDRSVDSMDFAMRRRFTFMELKANECLVMLDDLQLSDGISKDDIIAKMTALNSKIEEIPGLSSAYHIGGSYFAKLSKYADKPKDEAYKCLWNNHLKPLLTDYLRGLPNLEAKLSSFKTKYDEAEFVAPKNSDE